MPPVASHSRSNIMGYGLSNPDDKMKHGIMGKVSWGKPEKRGLFGGKFVEFCRRTDLHGYKYIVMDDLTTVERTCWALAVVFSTAVAAYFVVTAYKWYARNPIVTVIESTQSDIWDVPFPAVTICNVNVVSRKAANLLASNMSLKSNETKDFVLEALQLIPLLHSVHAATTQQKQRLMELQVVLEHNNLSITQLFKDVSPVYNCNDLIQKCMWKNTIQNCEELFQQIFTVFSVCCTFNYFGVDPSKLKNDPKGNKFIRKRSPRRAASCGYQTGLTVLINTNVDDYYSSIVASHGALILIDSATNVPNHDSPARFVNPSTEVLIALSPEQTYATSGIKPFAPSQRQCYYSDEVPLGNFNYYSLHNCLSYMEMNIYKESCKCVPYYAVTQGNTRICNFFDMDCLEEATKSMDVFNSTSSWDCLPECEHFDYPIEVAMGKLANNGQLERMPFFSNVNLKNQSVLNVFFNDLVSTRYRRDVYLNWQNILAAFGGLLSLMLGFTLISGIDILLFLALRVVHDPHKIRISDTSDSAKKVNNTWMDSGIKKSDVY